MSDLLPDKTKIFMIFHFSWFFKNIVPALEKRPKVVFGKHLKRFFQKDFFFGKNFATNHGIISKNVFWNSESVIKTFV